MTTLLFTLLLTTSIQAKALRAERDKAAKKREQVQQNVRLSYDDASGTYLLGGDQGEVQRIIRDLNKLAQVQSHPNEVARGNQIPSPLPSPLPSRPLGMDDVFDNLSLSFLKEAADGK